jgi:hypothetical protein
VGPRACLDDVEKRKRLPIPGLELRHLGRPARSQRLYRLRYPGSLITTKTYGKLELELHTTATLPLGKDRVLIAWVGPRAGLTLRRREKSTGN